MNSIIILLVLFLISSQTYISYITFLLCMIHLIFYILLLGNYYLSLIYLIIYVGSIAILFVYILMVLSIITSYRYGYILFILPLIILSILGIYIPYHSNLYNILTLSYSIYTSLIIPISLILLIAMIFAIRYI